MKKYTIDPKDFGIKTSELPDSCKDCVEYGSEICKECLKELEKKANETG